ncbi:DUF2007 domain-containing protein [Salinimicrobium sp. MT39]|jgi:hypothetical protein|uniref:DUF2007 domain-containing protein n=1 Tax=Salinimicrobium profundisediminis TaxID=2994553 RepID=A0A9X3I178_9FLAO|nr:DUF2007 domain-containing protein [Salinimicrobium profundisediminis]MCX2837667.1 DUF2007 domain-containing protein [Salinimicrobium profundisediminis]
MSDEEQQEYKRVYTGSEVNVQHLQNLLEEEGIATRVRNDFDSGLRAGFGGGLPGQVLLFARSKDYEKALRITNETFPDSD